MELHSPPIMAAAAPPARKASLYVGDLHPEVTEIDLIQAFSQIAPLTSVRICRDRNSSKSLCHGYVNFFHIYDACRAFASLNHTDLKGKAMRIMWCQRDPIARKNNIANLYVKNLVSSVTSAQLEGIFYKYGTILSCKVAEDDKGESKGFGFVQFESEDSAMAALNALNGTILEGKQLYVGKFMKKSERNGTSEETFRNLHEEISEDPLGEKFSEQGKLCSIAIMKDNEGQSKDFGFMEFRSHEESRNAVEFWNDTLLGSKNLFVDRAQKKEEREHHLKCAYETMHNANSEQSKGSNLYVKNLDVWVDDKMLEAFFIPYGKVVSAKVICDDTGVSKRFGFVRFSCPEDAKKALSLNGSTVLGMSLSVALAWSREECTRQLGRRQAPYSKQPFHYSNLNVLCPEYYPLCYNVPLPPISSFQPNQYQNFSICHSRMSTCSVQNPQGKFSTCPMKFSTSYVSPQDNDVGGLKQQKPSIIPTPGKNSTCGMEASCGKPIFLWRPVKRLPQGTLQNKKWEMLHPHLQNIEGDVDKRTSVLVKMDTPESLKVPNSLDSLTQQLKQDLHL